MKAKTGKKKNATSNTIKVEAPEDEAEKQNRIAATILRPSILGAVTIQSLSKSYGEIDVMALAEDLAKQSKAVNDGSLKRAETMLVTQAHTLDAIFNNLAQRAALNMGEYINAAERYMRLALKAQSQCRATLQTLGELKNPQPVAFVKQANISNGPQQVNNGEGYPHTSHARARGKKSKSAKRTIGRKSV